MNRQEAYQETLRLYEQGLGPQQIHNLIPQIPLATVGRWIYTDSTPDYSKNRPDLSPSAPLAYVLGSLYGDGYTCIHRHNYCIGLRVKDKEFVIAFSEAMNKIKLYPHIYFQERKYYRAIVSSKKFVEWFRELSFGKVESLISGCETDFIRGFYDSEGSLGQCWRRRTFRIYFGDTNFELLQLIGRLLSQSGFQTNTYKIKTPENCKQFYHLWLLGGNSEVTRFLKLIQPSIPRKSIRRIEGLT